MKKRDREFWIEIITEGIKVTIENLSNAIIYKLAKALSGEDFTTPPDAEGVSVANDGFIKSLVDRGLTEKDIQELKKAGVDLSSVTFVEHEVE